MSRDDYRWQASMGALAAALLAEAELLGSPVLGEHGTRNLDNARSLLSGDPLAIGLPPADAVGVAIGLAGSDGSGPPLLADRTTVGLIELVAALVDGNGPAVSPPGEFGTVYELAQHAESWADMLTAVRDTRGSGPELELEDRLLVAALFGAIWGLGAVPARPLSALRTRDGRRVRRILTNLTRRLLGLPRPNWYDPRAKRGPTEVLPGLWLSNIYGAKTFSTRYPDGLILSLCDPEGRLGDSDNAITFHLDDSSNRDANPALCTVLDEVLSELGAARAAGRPVLVHCRHGASRTGLVLRALLVTELAVDAEQALTEAQCLWPATSNWNHAWNREIEDRARALER